MRAKRDSGKIFAGLCIAAVTAALLFAAAEVAARFIYKKAPRSGFTTRSSLFHHLPPPYYSDIMTSAGDYEIPFSTNNKGMRGPRDFVYEKEPGVFRIAVLGDSFTFGVGVKDEEVFTRLIEKGLNASGGRRYEVLNFGVPSYSPSLEYIYTRNEVVKYSPDLAILMLDLTDIQDDYHYEPHIVYGRNGEIAGCDPMKLHGRPDIWEMCKKHSRFLSMLDLKLFQSFAKMRTIGLKNYILNKLKGRRNKDEILVNKDIDNIRFDRFLMMREGKNSEVVARHWARTAKYVTMIKEYLDGRGIRFILAVYPYGHQVGPDQWSRGRSYWAFGREKVYDPAPAFGIVEEFAKRSHIDLVNLYAGIAKDKDKKLYFDNDGHWTAAGHAAAADAMLGSDIFEKDLK